MKTNLKQRNNLNQKQRVIFTIIALIIPLINFAVFTIGMNGAMFINSFNYLDHGKSAFGFHQYETLFRNLTSTNEAIPFVVLKNTLLIIPVSILTTCISLVMSYAVARKFFGFRFFRIILYAPCILSTVVLASVVKILCNQRYGILGVWLNDKFPLGILDASNVWNVIILFSIWSGCTINLYFMSSFARLPESAFESAQLDGASETVLFFRIAFPLVSSLFVTLLLSSICGSFTFFAPVYFFAQSDATQAHTLGYKLVMFANSQTGAKLNEFTGLYSALGVVLTVVASCVAVLTRWVGSKLAVEDLEY